MNLSEVFLDKNPLRLGRRIGRGGEGDVYEVQNDSASAVKIYTTTDVKERESKVSAMVHAGLASRSPLASFPNAIIRDRKGVFLGFKMKLVRNHKPLHELYAPGPRKHNFPQADYRFLVRAASNLARAVASVHSSGCVIGDINHSGVLISPQATASLIDADSFQFSLGSNVFLCRVGVPEYTPPELQGKPLGSVVRTANHDCFGLAVIVFQLLFMGRHPFVGTVRRGDIPPLNEAIRDYRFAYTEGRDVGMDQPPGTPALADFSLEVGKYFEAAFGRQSMDKRPTASDWIHVLDALEASLVACPENKLHYIPRDSDECPWCHMENQLGTVLFVPFVPAAKLVEGIDPGADGFSIDTIWRQIASVTIPPRTEILPKCAPTPAPPAPSLLERLSSKLPLPKAISAVAAIAIVVLAPKVWLLSLGLGAYAIFGGRTSDQTKQARLREQFIDLEHRWHTEVVAWQKRIGVDDFLQLEKELQAARAEYTSLDQQKRAELENYKRERRQKQLLAFLENFEIRNAEIKGIGSAKQLALASYGVDTAADITMLKVLAVPGIGNSIGHDLLKWRSACEQRFVYSERTNQTDLQELTKISLKFSTKAAILRRVLSVGHANVSASASRILQAREIEDPLLNRINAERDNAKQKLSALGITPPNVQFDWSTLAKPNAASSASGAVTPKTPTVPPPSLSARGASAGTPSCPRCGSRMVRRVARRGRNAGGAFWGCSRFPTCRGTRN